VTDQSIRIEPGHWRPEGPYEQIAWVHLPWPGAGLVMLDFPEAIFSDQGLLFLSHVSRIAHQRWPDLPKVEWEPIERGIRFERRLPNGFVYGGSLAAAADNRRVDMALWARNEDDIAIGDLKTQVCVYLPKALDFAAKTMDNKWVHVAGRGWTRYPEALASEVKTGRWRLGWRSGLPSCDVPLIATESGDGRRWLLTEWGDATYALTGNPDHPCMHADPDWPDLEPGQQAEIAGRLYLHDGTLDEFLATWHAFAS